MSKSKIKNILITGGAGHIGGSLARRLVTDPSNHVVIVDNLSTGRRANLPARNHANWRFIKTDVNQRTELAKVFRVGHFNYIFHYAAAVGVQRTLAKQLAVLADTRGIENVLELARRQGVKRVFYSSSSEVYGEPVEFPQNEATTPLNARLPYAAVKNIGECWFKTYQQIYDLPYTIFRFFNTYGPLQSPDFVIPRFLRAALAGQPLTLYGAGRQTRTFCYIDDNLDVVEKILKQELCRNQIINLGNDQEISIKQLAQTIIKLTGSPSRLHYLPPLKEGDMTRRRPDITKMQRILGRPLTPLAAGIARLLLTTAQPIKQGSRQVLGRQPVLK